MKHRRLLITAILLLLGIAPLAAVTSSASGGRGVSATPAGEHSSTQRSARQKKQKRKPAPRAQSFSKDLAELRAQFNRDKGRVRLLMLLSPT